MEYEHEVGEEDDLWNFAESGISIISVAPVLVATAAAVNQDDNVKDKGNDDDDHDAVAIAKSKSSGRTRIDMMMTENDNDNQNSRVSGNSCAEVVNLLAEYSYSSKGGGTSDNNHRLKNMHKQESQSHRPAREMEDSRRRHCNSSSLMRPARLLRRTTSPYSPSSALRWSTTSSRFLMLACTVFLIATVAEASNYSTRNNITNNNSNLVDDSHQQQSDKPDKLFKDFSVLEDINLIEDLENSADFSGNDNEVDDHHSHLHHNGDKEHYTHQWAVHILGGPEVARRVAEKHGFQFHGEIFKDYYHLIHSRVAKRSIEAHTHYHERLASEPEVRWLMQQTVKRRAKRDFLAIPSPSHATTGGGQKSGRIRAARRSKSIVLNDPRWPAMWYLNRGGGLDMNVLEAWNEGITGKGIVVTILDDGLEKDHPDIVRNYDPMASFDVNSLDPDPMPTYDLTDSNRHGTRCAGEVAAEANNSICAVGIAYEAGVGGVRMLDGDVTDAVEARSLSHNPQHIDIYSASWGPDDDGKTVDGPGELATRAFIEGVTKGRSGKGSIFVWASGNGGRDHDNCNCDGYTNSIWTLSISSATENGLVPWYSEACSSTLATTYSSGGTGEKQIVTIDLHHSCTSSHTGTSASAPLAAGICALALQANTNLTWRDMQHIVVRTARPLHLIANDWATNGVGRNVSHSFGYGLMDAGAMVKLAKKWKQVPPQHKCEIKAPYTDKNIPSKSKVTLDLKVLNCPNVNYLEHVQAKVTLTSGRRGDLQIFLISPSGTKSQLLAHRRHDLNRAGFTDWPFMTVHSWGESPIGKWTLEIHNEGRYAGRTVLKRWSLIFYGTEEDVSVNANYSSSTSNKDGYSSYVVYTPRNSSASSVVDMIETTKGESGGGASSSGRNKSGRPRIKGKLISKKQKGATTPTGKPVGQLQNPNNSPSESHVIITSDDEEFRQFLQSKFGLVRMSSSLLGGISASGGGGSSTSSNAGKRNFGNWTSSSGIPGVSVAHALIPIKDEAAALTTLSSSSSSTSSSSTSTMIRASSLSSSSSPQVTPLLPTPTSESSATKSIITLTVNLNGTNNTGTSGGTTERSSSTSARLSTTSSETLTRNVNSIKTTSVDTSSPLPTSLNLSSSNHSLQGTLQTWSLIAHGITTNPNDLAGGSGTGEGGKTGVDGGRSSDNNGQQYASHPASGAVVEAFDGSENTILAGDSSSSSLQNSGAPLPAHAGVAKPVSIVGRPSSPSAASSADCAKMSAQGQCLECVPGLALLHENCVSRCPDTFYVETQGRPSLQPDTTLDSSNRLHYVCLPCHYSCQTCSGPSDDECVSCYDDAKLHRVTTESTNDPRTTTDKAHCYPLALMDTLDRSDLSHRVLLIIVALSIVFIVFMLSFLCCDCCRNSNGGKGVYEESAFKKAWRPGSQEQAYNRLPEEVDDEDDEYEEYSSGNGRRLRSGNKQTHLELISEDDEEDEEREDFEHVHHDSDRDGVSVSLPPTQSQRSLIRNPSGGMIPPKVPLVLQSHSSGRPSSSINSENVNDSGGQVGPLV